MRERDRLVIKAHKEEIAAQELAEREAAERPIKEAEQKLQSTYRDLIKIQRENLLKLPDPDIFISPAMQGASMSKADAMRFNEKQANLFVQITPEYLPFRSQDNSKILLRYFSRNGISLFDSEMLTKAFYKLRDLGLLTEKPEPEPPVLDTPEPIEAAPQQPDTEEGFDLESGERRTYTKREIAAMSSETYRRVFRTYRDNLAYQLRFGSK